MYCVTPQSHEPINCDQPDALVVMTRLELAQYSPFYLDLESAARITAALLLVWAVAFLFRQAIKAVKQSEEEI